MNLDKITYAMKSFCDEARQEGYNAGYEQGLEDAWECARRIDCDRGLENYVFDNDLDNGFRNVSVSKAIVRVKEYDEMHKAIKEMAIITDSSVKEIEEAISKLEKKLKQEKMDAEMKVGEIND